MIQTNKFNVFFIQFLKILLILVEQNPLLKKIVFMHFH